MRRAILIAGSYHGLNLELLSSLCLGQEEIKGLVDAMIDKQMRSNDGWTVAQVTNYYRLANEGHLSTEEVGSDFGELSPYWTALNGGREEDVVWSRFTVDDLLSSQRVLWGKGRRVAGLQKELLRRIDELEIEDIVEVLVRNQHHPTGVGMLSRLCVDLVEAAAMYRYRLDAGKNESIELY
jgi:hypothetical protein